MPIRAPRICSCGKVVPYGVICDCQLARKKAFDRSRPTAAARGYGARWQRESREFLERNPVCKMNGCGKIARVVDHITPHKGNHALFWDKRNWQPLCVPCHSRIKQRMERGRV